MRCVITYTRSSQSQTFSGAETIVASLEEALNKVTVEGLKQRKENIDDRLAAAQQ